MLGVYRDEEDVSPLFTPLEYADPMLDLSLDIPVGLLTLWHSNSSNV